MGDWILTLLVVGSAVIVAVAALAIVRRAISLEQMRRNNEVAGFIYAVVGVVYAMMLAFVVVMVWDEFKEVKAGISDEVGSIGTLYHDAIFLPEEIRTPLRQSIRNYAHSILHDEWQLLEEERSSRRADEAFSEVRRLVHSFRPSDGYQESLFAAMIGHIDRMAASRRQRLLSSEDHLPDLMWVLLIGGGVITVAYALLFGTESFPAHNLMIGSLAGIVAMALLLIAALDQPFSGIVRVDPDPFVHLIEGME
jgi:hypothetical protein